MVHNSWWSWIFSKVIVGLWLNNGYTVFSQDAFVRNLSLDLIYLLLELLISIKKASAFIIINLLFWNFQLGVLLLQSDVFV